MTGSSRQQGYIVATWLLAGLVLVQIGLALFGLPVQVHVVIGLTIGCLAIALLWWTGTSEVLRPRWMLAAVVAALVVLQPFLLAVSAVLPRLSAAHAINAFAILGVALAQALDSDGIASIAAPDGLAETKERRKY